MIHQTQAVPLDRIAELAGRPHKAYKVPPVGLTYATVHKTRSKGRVVKGEPRIILGAAQAAGAAPAHSLAIRALYTSFVERQNGTDRNRNVRKSYGFAKDWSVHEAATFFAMYSHSFCRPIRALRIEGKAGTWLRQTSAMASGVADHVWSLTEWLFLPAVHRKLAAGDPAEPPLILTVAGAFTARSTSLCRISPRIRKRSES